MKYTDTLIYFMAIFLAIYSVIFVHTTLEQATNRANNLYAHYIATACQDALEINALDAATLKDNMEKNNTNVWEEIQVREDTVNTFYKSFALSLNKEGEGFYNNIELMTPIICLIDVGGYYLSYNAAFDNNSTSHNDYLNLHNISSINTWSENINGYTIRYYLSDYVQVIGSDGILHEGNRREVYAALQDSALEFLVQDEVFKEYKNACVVQTINKQLEYYVNNLNNKADKYDTQYVITMPENEGETWFGLLDKPAICAFVQGTSLNIRNQKVSVYGFGIYEVGEPLHYFILDLGNGKKYYCYEDKQLKNELGWTGELPIYQGLTIEQLYTSKKDCAEEGAYPEIY